MTAAKLKGLMSSCDLAERLKVVNSTVYQWQKKGIVPLPTHPMGSRLYYTVEEIREILEQFNNTNIKEGSK